MCACVCAYMPTNEREPVGERRGREGSVGITTGGSGGGETEDESFAQPSITSLGLGFIWNNSSSLLVVWKHTTHRKPGGGRGG